MDLAVLLDETRVYVLAAECDVCLLLVYHSRATFRISFNVIQSFRTHIINYMIIMPA